eukprot:12906316-Prorocentrum_lima.AAC.1
MYNRFFLWDGSHKPINIMASHDVLKMNGMDHMLLRAVRHLKLTSGDLYPGISQLATRIREAQD